MKKNLTLLTFTMCFAIAVNAQTVTQTHMAFQTTKTATWCNPCGTWAWPMQQAIVAANSAHAVCVELHYSSSDAIYNSIAEALQNDFPYVGSVPAWYLNGKNWTVYSASGGIYTTSTQNALQNGIDSTYNVPADVQSAYTFSLVGNNLTVTTNTKFFNTVTGTYNLAIYMIENNVIAYQNGIGNSASHQDVLRKSMSTSSFGDQVATGTIAANTIVPLTFTSTITTGWNAQNIWLAAVLWKSNGSSYDYVNAYTNRMMVGIDDMKAMGIDFSIFPNPIAEEGRISISAENNINHCSIALMDMTGREVASIYTGTLHQGQNEFLMDTGKLENGLYMVNISSAGNVTSRKIVIAR